MLTRRAILGMIAGSFQEPFKITDNVDLVLLDVCVKSKEGAYVTKLDKSAFSVWVDGRAQTISHFSRVDSPVTVGLIVDNSGSMRAKRPEVVLAGLAFAKQSNPQDEFFVVNFNNTVAAGLPPATPFTDQLQLLHQALYMGEVVGQTALYDAIAYGLKHLEAGHRDKRTLIVVSDGGDNVSQLSQSAIIDLIQRSRASIYTIGLSDPEDRDLRPAILKKFAAISGGEYFEPAKLDDVMSVMGQISKDIRSRYSIGFAPPPDAAGKTVHNIKVVATDEGHKLQVHTRTTYNSDLFANLSQTSLRSWR